MFARSMIAAAALSSFGAVSAHAIEVVGEGFVYDVERLLECVVCGTDNAFIRDGLVTVSGTITTARLGTITSGDDIIGFDLVATTDVSGLGPLPIVGTGSEVSFFGDGELEARVDELEFGGSAGAGIGFNSDGGAFYEIIIASFFEQVQGAGPGFFIEARAFDRTISSDVIGTRAPVGPPPPQGEVPLPAAGWMMVAGLGAMIGARRRRRSA